MKLKLSEVRSTVREVMIERRATSNKKLIEGILNEKEGFLSNMARKVGISNPSRDVDDPKHVEKNLQKTFDNVMALGKKFADNALRSTEEINKYHTAISDMLDKVTSLSDTLGPERSKAYHSKMISTVRDFYKNLKDESGRIDSFLKTLSSDLNSKGISPSKASANTAGLKGGKPNSHPQEAPLDVDDDYEVEKVIGKKPTRTRDAETPDLDVDDEDEVRNFLKGKKGKSAAGV